MHRPPPQGYPQPYGYPPPQGYGPPPPPPGNRNVLYIVLAIVAVVLVLGAGSCLVCVGVAAVASKDTSADPVLSPAAGLEHTPLAQQLETAMRGTSVPVAQVLCPRTPPAGTFQCELVTTGGDRAMVNVTAGPTGLAYDVPNIAFLDGDKLGQTFAGIVGPSGARLTVPCFTGTLMKPVGGSFTCPVVDGVAAAGQVSVLVRDKTGAVKMTYEVTRSVPLAGKPRTVDFPCPVGHRPGVAVRGGCMCGDEIHGTACGASGSFTDVVATPTGCRFTCD